MRSVGCILETNCERFSSKRKFPQVEGKSVMMKKSPHSLSCKYLRKFHLQTPVLKRVMFKNCIEERKK